MRERCERRGRVQMFSFFSVLSGVAMREMWERRGRV